LTLSIPNAAAFKTDMVAQTGVKTGIATAHSTTTHTVAAADVALIIARRLLDSSGRRLEDSVSIDYTISDVPETEMAAVVKKGKGLKTSELSDEVARAVKKR